MFARPFKPSAKALEVASRLCRLEQQTDIDAYAPQVIAAFRDCGADSFVFWEIDEHEGYFRGLDGRFHMLRRVRNHSRWHVGLFDALKANARG